MVKQGRLFLFCISILVFICLVISLTNRNGVMHSIKEAEGDCECESVHGRLVNIEFRDVKEGERERGKTSRQMSAHLLQESKSGKEMCLKGDGHSCRENTLRETLNHDRREQFTRQICRSSLRWCYLAFILITMQGLSVCVCQMCQWVGNEIIITVCWLARPPGCDWSNISNLSLAAISVISLYLSSPCCVRIHHVLAVCLFPQSHCARQNIGVVSGLWSVCVCECYPSYLVLHHTHTCNTQLDSNVMKCVCLCSSPELFSNLCPS